jgi:hypothetical protein
VAITGVGGGIFLTPPLTALGLASPKRSAQLSPPFLLAGQQLAPGTFLYECGALAGATIGTAIYRSAARDTSSPSLLVCWNPAGDPIESKKSAPRKVLGTTYGNPA